jgi:hypothetical protein
MKRYTPTQRLINIISRATESGFELPNSLPFDHIAERAIDYLIDRNEIDREEECQLVISGYTQYAVWSDGIGYDWWCSGHIVQLDDRWTAQEVSEGKKVFRVHTVLDSEGKLVQLVHTVYAAE